MTYPQQPGGGWQDQSWPNQQPYVDPNQPASPAVGYPASPAAGYPASPAGYQDYQGYQAGYGTPGYPATYGYSTPAVIVPTAPTNGLAIASLVCSIAGIVTCGITSIIGAILGHVARKQIRERGEGGDGLALAGVITGWIMTALWALGIAAYVVFFIVLVAAVSNSPGFDPSYYPYPSAT
jgi:hypothetical protein